MLQKDKIKDQGGTKKDKISKYYKKNKIKDIHGNFTKFILYIEIVVCTSYFLIYREEYYIN
jgi:hypothetical protein